MSGSEVDAVLDRLGAYGRYQVLLYMFLFFYRISGSEVDAVLDRLGGYGRYQVLLYVSLGLVNMRGAWHVFVSMFVAWNPPHYCTPDANHTLNQSLPWQPDDTGQVGGWPTER